MDFATSQGTIKILDEGLTIANKATQINFVGAGVSGTAIGNAVTETVTGGSGGTIIKNEAVGTGDGTTVSFTLAHTPLNGVDLRLNGISIVPGAGNDYTISGTTITFVNAPASGNLITAFYEF